MTDRDRLRELLDAVLDEEHTSLGAMAEGAYASPYHFSRELARLAGEPPVAMRRRVMLERASWRLRAGCSVTDAAFEAGYDSVEGFSRAYTRAYGEVPSRVRAGALTGTQTGTETSRDTDAASRRPLWLPAPNGIHFHPPTSLWVRHPEDTVNPLTEQLVQHDLDDTRTLLEEVKGVPDQAYRHVGMPGNFTLSWDGKDESIADALEHLVATKEIWLAAFEGGDFPTTGADSPTALLDRHDALAPRWLEAVRDFDRRGAWDDRMIDALCEPPESFVIGSVVAHVLTFAAARRQLVRQLLRAGGHEIDHGDPIEWLRARLEATPS